MPGRAALAMSQSAGSGVVDRADLTCVAEAEVALDREARGAREVVITVRREPVTAARRGVTHTAHQGGMMRATALPRHVAIGSIALLLAAAPAAAVSTSFWRVDSFEGFAAGDASGISILEEGALVLSPDFVRTEVPDAGYVWSVVPGPRGAAYLVAGTPGRLYELEGGELTLLFETATADLPAVAVGYGGDVFVGTAPGGQVYRVKPDGTSGLFHDTGQGYVWSMAYSRAHGLLVGTGSSARVLSLDEDGEASVLYESSESSITVLACAGDRVLAGTSGDGLLLDITPERSPAVLFDSASEEISAIAPDVGGETYFASTSVSLDEALERGRRPGVHARRGSRLADDPRGRRGRAVGIDGRARDLPRSRPRRHRVGGNRRDGTHRVHRPAREDRSRGRPRRRRGAVDRGRARRRARHDGRPGRGLLVRRRRRAVGLVRVRRPRQRLRGHVGRDPVARRDALRVGPLVLDAVRQHPRAGRHVERVGSRGGQRALPGADREPARAVPPVAGGTDAGRRRRGSDPARRRGRLPGGEPPPAPRVAHRERARRGRGGRRRASAPRPPRRCCRAVSRSPSASIPRASPGATSRRSSAACGPRSGKSSIPTTTGSASTCGSGASRRPRGSSSRRTSRGPRTRGTRSP